MFKLISILLFVVINLIYNIFIIAKYKTIPVSLSETSYMLGGLKRYWFTIYCVTNVLLILPNLLVAVPETFTFLVFLMCTGMLFSGVSPLFKKGLDKTVHYVSSIFSFIMFIVFMILLMKWYCLIVFIVILGLLVMWKKECYVYFAEILAFIFIILYLI